MRKTFTYVDGLPTLEDLPEEEFNGKRFYVLPSGQKVPSVTTVLSWFPKPAIEEWKIREGEENAARQSNLAKAKGTKLHKLMEDYIGNKKIGMLAPDMQEFFVSGLPTINRIDNIHYVEGKLYSEKLRMAGRSDLIAEFDGKLSIIDFKTSANSKREEWIIDYFIQETAYAVMYEELFGTPVDWIVTIIFTPDELVPQVFCKRKQDYIKYLKEKVDAYYANNIH